MPHAYTENQLIERPAIGLLELDWVPVAVEEQRIRNELRRGFQKHLLRFRRAEQMETPDEWNVERCKPRVVTRHIQSAAAGRGELLF